MNRVRDGLKIALYFVLLFYFFIPAGEALSLGITPSSLNFENLKQDSQVSGTFFLTGRGVEGVTYCAEISGTGAEYVRLSNGCVVLGGGPIQMSFSITPKDAPTGEYAVRVIMSPQSPTGHIGDENAPVVLMQKIHGTITFAVTQEDIHSIASRVVGYADADVPGSKPEITVRFKNNGNIHEIIEDLNFRVGFSSGAADINEFAYLVRAAGPITLEPFGGSHDERVEVPMVVPDEGGVVYRVSILARDGDTALLDETLPAVLIGKPAVVRRVSEAGVPSDSDVSAAPRAIAGIAGLALVAASIILRRVWRKRL